MLRASRTRWLLLVVALGILVADILICTVPLYNTLVSDFQLRNTITRSNAEQRTMQVSVGANSVNRTVSQQIARGVQAQADRYLTHFTAPHPLTYISSDPLTVFVQNPDVAKRRWDPFTGTVEARVQAFDYTTLRPYLRFLHGTFPQTLPPTSTGSRRLQIIVTRELADYEDLTVGQMLIVSDENGELVPATITGIFEQVNANDPFWNGLSFDALPQHRLGWLFGDGSARPRSHHRGAVEIHRRQGHAEWPQ
jgi:hypothetical protein